MPVQIARSVVWNAEAEAFNCFHPRACVLPGKPRKLFMTVQEVSGSDYFHAVQCCESEDDGRSWSRREAIPGFGWIEREDGISEGVCDVHPDFHAPTGSVFCMGHTVFYRDGHLLDTLGDFRKDALHRRIQRLPVYQVRGADGSWGERRTVEIDEFADASIYTSNCSQRIMKDDGTILFPITFGEWGRHDRMVCSVQCTFDGCDLCFRKRGNILELPVGRGLLEPQMTEFSGRYYLSIRAEDNHGHVSCSGDGFAWEEIKPWCWENGEPLTMSTTQQHWLSLGGKLYLVYTRKAPINENVIRWRSPLFMAEVDSRNLCLLRDTEQIVFPMQEGVPQERIALMGNFHPTKLDDSHAIITVGASESKNNYRSDLLTAWLSC